MDNRPQGRDKNVTGQGKGIYKRGEGLNTGPVGSQNGHAGRPGTPQQQRPAGTGRAGYSTGGTSTRAGGRSPLLIVIIIVAVLVLGGGAGLGGLFGGGGSSDVSYDSGSSYGGGYSSSTGSSSSGFGGSGSSSGSAAGSLFSGLLSGGSGSALSGLLSGGAGVTGSTGSGLDLASLLGGGSSVMPASASSFGSVSSGWSSTANVGKLNTSVAAGARAKRTAILGNGRDVVTIMVYMCGTDLESKHSMGTADLQEMLAATLSDNINLIVYTGGCKKWQNNVVSSSVNQIYQIKDGKLRTLVADAGTDTMVKPATLRDFIQFCAENFPANRNELIFWDHGGGSLSGYGYDEKNPNSGSMSLAGISSALQAAGVTFDFIGFDACLMATLENALMLTDHADYLIASEETEPGVGWYYTNWLTALGKNTSMSTLEIGKNIVDDFVTVCNQRCAGQNTTLSVVDLAELEKTVPASFKSFASSTSSLISEDYKTVSSARGGTREFAASSRIDQIDLVDLANRLGTEESKALAEVLLSAVKYNRTSSSINNAYGLSIYFPYQKTGKVNAAVNTYNAIGLDSEYSRCIQQFASMEVGGQSASGASGNPLSSLLGGGSYATSSGSDAIGSLLSGLMSSGSLFGRSSADLDGMTDYISANQLDPNALVWTPDGDTVSMKLSYEQWSLVNDLELSVFYDDGEGYIDLGLDNVFTFTEDGALIGEFDATWLAIDQQPVAYYHTATVRDGDSYTITGRVPVLLNGERAELLLVFDSEHPTGYIAGARSDYQNGETETVAKAVTELQAGDVIDFVCDYYSYDGTYLNSYMLGEQYVYDGSAEISNVTIDASAVNATYKITDIYCQEYWTPVIP